MSRLCDAVCSLSMFFFFECSGPHRDLHSFPTRRSSDLLMVDANMRWSVDEAIRAARALAPHAPVWLEEPTIPDDVPGQIEEHTSELQSLTNLVCRLLLEKKKKKTNITNNDTTTK